MNSTTYEINKKIHYLVIIFLIIPHDNSAYLGYSPALKLCQLRPTFILVKST